VLTRRDLLEGCVALATAMSAGGAFAPRRMHGSADPPSVPTLLVDACVSGRERLERAALGIGVRLLDAGTDLAPILYGTLLPEWRRQLITALAGLTSATSLLYIEHAASDWGLRTVFLARHGAGGKDARWLRGPDCMLDRFTACARLEGWRNAAVSTSLRLPLAGRPLGCSQAHLAPDMIPDGALYSWTLMPIAPAATAATPQRCL